MNKGFSILALPQGRLLALIALWWGFWLCAARWAYPRFVDSGVAFLVVGSISCFVLAAWMALRWQQKRLPSSANDLVVSHEHWPMWGLLLVVFYQLFLESSALGVLVHEGAAAYRGLAYVDADRVFGNWKWIWPYDNLLMPFGVYCGYRWLANGNQRQLWLASTICFFALDTLTRMGRFPIYMMLVCFGFAWVLRPRKIGLVKVIAVGVTLIGLLVMGVIRNNGMQNGLDRVGAHLMDSVVNYHIYGFGILGHFVQGLDKAETPGIPFLSAGFLWSPIHLFRGLATDLGLIDYYSNFNAYIQHGFDLGSFMPNAFTTLLLPFWLDGGAVWLFTVMAAVGLLFGSSFVQKGSLRPSGLALVVAHIMIFGIFQPILNSQWFYVPLFTHFIANTWIRYRHAKH